MKKILTLILLLPLIAPASTEYEPGIPLTQEQLDEIKAEDEALGLVTADSGLEIVQPSEVKMFFDEDDHRKKFHKDMKEMKQRGYVKEDSPDAKSLLAMRNPGNSVREELKTDLSDIKLAFPYPGLPFIPKENVIGYSGFIGWDNGWLGILEFFKDKDFEVCNYERHNMKLSHGGVRLIAEDLEYDINGKPTHYMVRGNDKTGYAYYTTWYDPTYIHNLQCATERFKADGIDKLLELGITIDKVE
jgi:hypothetical protein